MVIRSLRLIVQRLGFPKRLTDMPINPTDIDSADSCVCEAKRQRLDDEVEDDSSSHGVESKDEGVASRSSRHTQARKYAMLMCYSGSAYLGMQLQPSHPTIELELLKAMRTIGLIDDDDARKPGNFRFQRAARTDKGVSAVRQVCSFKLPIENPTEFIQNMNERLPAAIRVIALQRVTKKFDARNACSSRTYSYVLPTFAFAHADEKMEESFRLPMERLKEINDVLKVYEGTHNFYNFTSNRLHSDKSCIRFVIKCECSAPFEYEDMEFVTITINGQSFILHQIRKMIGLGIAIVRGLCDKSLILKAWRSADRVDVPKAPGLGLTLMNLHYDRYNQRYEKTHEPITWTEFDAQVEEFWKSNILENILKAEKSEKSMLSWLTNLCYHDFDFRKEGPNPKRVVPGVLADEASAHSTDDVNECKKLNEPTSLEAKSDEKKEVQKSVEV